MTLPPPFAPQANAIYLELERMGFKVWYDNRADDLTKEGMLKGIEQAAAFILVSGLTLRCCSLLCRSQAFVCCAHAWNRPPVPFRGRA